MFPPLYFYHIYAVIPHILFWESRLISLLDFYPQPNTFSILLCSSPFQPVKSVHSFLFRVFRIQFFPEITWISCLHLLCGQPAFLLVSLGRQTSVYCSSVIFLPCCVQLISTSIVPFFSTHLPLWFLVWYFDSEHNSLQGTLHYLQGDHRVKVIVSSP